MAKNYETFKTVKSKEDFFSTWDTTEIANFSEELKNRIYDKYVLKSKILQRDNFKCQNINCKYPNSRLTIHHVKHQRNGGTSKVRNLISVCNTCHSRFNRCKDGLTFSKDINVPAHLRGATFALHKVESGIDWKKVKNDMKQCRKSLKYKDEIIKLNIKDWKLIYQLFKFLSQPYEEGDDNF